MKKFALVSTMLAGMTGAGCMHYQPIGPFAGNFAPPPKKDKDTSDDAPPPGAKVGPVRDAPAPVVVAAPAPPLPSFKVTPAEVQDNPQDAVKRMISELEEDRVSTDSMPTYTEVSVVKGSANR
ncbi:hypothetical protein [Fimbriiglobus ruber]|uniref:Uncharacterized protein n=1 Tax=Fimbriiglobus ruber TaxID=1908690 RepID=A0A225D0D7_9BACT|nr:hypothetical protein [Fimbriiglobus ruber]OWK35061.1 hypothetical protein FRUB_09903 [Fimbriiglobus ruber]